MYVFMRSSSATTPLTCANVRARVEEQSSAQRVALSRRTQGLAMADIVLTKGKGSTQPVTIQGDVSAFDKRWMLPDIERSLLK